MRRIGSAARDAERESVMTLQTMLSLNIRFSQSINEMSWIPPIQGVVDEIRRSNDAFHARDFAGRIGRCGRRKITPSVQ